MQFQFATAAQIQFGAGKHREIAALAAPLGKKALVVSGAGGAHPEKITEPLEDAGIAWQSFIVHSEPTVELVQDGVKRAKAAGCDHVIAFGGGSVLDTGKAIAAMLTNPGDVLDYLEVVGKGMALKQRSAPMIAIPTTAGTGSEVTRNAVLAVTDKKVKVSMRSAWMLPAIALIDPELMMSMPPAVTASSGMDALTQVIEPFVCSRANAMTDVLAREGIQRAGRSLKEAYYNGANLAAREDMAWASLLGGLCLANAGLGAVHGFAGPIGGMFDAPHGAVCARLLPIVCAANVKALQERAPEHIALQKYQEIACMLTGKPDADINQGVYWLEELTADLKIPGLSAYGITMDSIPMIMEKSRAASSMKANPIPLTDDELREILERTL